MSSRAWSNVPIGIAMVGGLLLAAGPAGAQSPNETLTVQARIGELCTVASALLDFGQSIDLDENTDAIGTIEINCASQTALHVQLDGGLNGGFGGARSMKNGGQHTITYGLYKNAGRTVAWNPGEQVPATINSSGSVSVFGRVPIQPNGHPSGLYTDAVTITLVF
jgi:spore coat protein U-like protein